MRGGHGADGAVRGSSGDGGDRIVEARFDVALLGNRRYDKIAVSELTVEV